MANPSAQSRKRAAPGSSAPMYDNINAEYNPIPITNHPYMPNMIPNLPGSLNSNVVPNANTQMILSQRHRGNTNNNGALIPMANTTQQGVRNANNNGPMSHGHGLQSTGVSGSWGSRGEASVTSENDEADSVLESAREVKIANAKAGKKQIPPFVQKLAQFVNDPTCDDVIRWSDSGKSFLVLDEDAFSKNLIPDLFKHNNYASFVRQLNMYGFHKVVALSDGSMKTAEQRSKPILEYTNPYFQRDQKDLLWLIHKPKNPKTKKPAGKQGKGKESDDESSEDGHPPYNDHVDMKRPQPKMIESGPSRGVPRPSTVQQGGSGQAGASQPQDLTNILQQLDSIKQHQAMISTAIARLRKEHQGLYDQAVAFQTLHDRHENSINHILNFLATVYDKTLGGHLPAPFASVYNAVASPNVNAPVANVVATPRGFKKAPLLLEDGRSSNVYQAHAMRGNPARVDLGNAPFPRTPYTNNTNIVSQNFGSDDIIQELRSSPKSVGMQSPVNTVDTPITDTPYGPATARSQQPSVSPLVTPTLSTLSPPRSRQQSVIQDMAPALNNFQGNVSNVGDQLKQLQSIQRRQDTNIDDIHLMLQSMAAKTGLSAPSPTPSLSLPVTATTTATTSGALAGVPLAPTPPPPFMDPLNSDFLDFEPNMGTPDMSGVDWTNMDPNFLDFSAFQDPVPKITSAASSPETVDDDGRELKKQRRR